MGSNDFKALKQRTFAACAGHISAACASPKMSDAMPLNRKLLKRLIEKGMQEMRTSSPTQAQRSTRRRNISGAQAPSHAGFRHVAETNFYAMNPFSRRSCACFTAVRNSPAVFLSSQPRLCGLHNAQELRFGALNRRLLRFVLKMLFRALLSSVAAGEFRRSCARWRRAAVELPCPAVL